MGTRQVQGSGSMRMFKDAAELERLLVEAGFDPETLNVRREGTACAIIRAEVSYEPPLKRERPDGSERSRTIVKNGGVVAQCEDKIISALSPTEIKVEGAYDDPNGSHITIYCVSEAFEGKRSRQRQQMVIKAIWDEMQGPVHAVNTMVLKAPSEV